MLESKFQAQLIKKLERLFPGCIILKNDEGYRQGIPDLAILWRGVWAMLECKANAKSAEQPNQRYYIDRANELSFAAFISPEVEEEVLDALQSAFRNQGQACVP